MSGNPIELSIFDPLQQYFKVLYALCDKLEVNCVDKNLVNMITNDCDISGNTIAGESSKTSKNFKEAVKLFALNLKQYDSPISNITIKGTLFTIITKAIMDAYGVTDVNTAITSDPGKVAGIVDAVTDVVKDNDICKNAGFVMIDDIYKGNGSSGKYTELLTAELGKSGSSTAKQIFNDWLEAAFNSPYGKSIDAFKELLAEIQGKYKAGTSMKLADYQKALMEKYFEIINDGAIMQHNDFWAKLYSDLAASKVLKSETFYDKMRLNVRVIERKDKGYHLDAEINAQRTKLKDPRLDDKNLIAAIAYAFPKDVRTDFDKELVKAQPVTDKARITTFKYALKSKCTDKISPETVDAMFKFIGKTLTPSSKKSGPDYELDVPDESDYTDSDGKPYKIADLEKEVGKPDTWAAFGDKLYKKDDKGKYVAYSKEAMEKDIESYKSNDSTTTCGNLCIFNTPDKCQEFFKGMTENKSYTFDKLAEYISKDEFVKSYQNLKKNIVNVNPIFVIGTLKAFKFEKYTELKEDGSKVVKVETFTRWWKRNGKQLMDTKVDPSTNVTLASKIGTDVYPTGTFPGVHKQKDLEPNPPANLELFLKLLVAFINNNQWVINPQSKEMINKLPKTTIVPNGKGNTTAPTFTYRDNNGIEHTVTNAAYKSGEEKANAESLQSILSEIKKNSYQSKPADMRSPENRNVLGLLMGAVLNPSSLKHSNKYSFGTGYGYLGFSGGAGLDLSTIDVNSTDKQVKEVANTMRPSARAALETYFFGIKALYKRNITLDSGLINRITANIEALNKSEAELYDDLEVLARYIKLANALDDEDYKDITIENMEQQINKYENSVGKVSKGNDTVNSLLLHALAGTSGPKSYYSSM